MLRVNGTILRASADGAVGRLRKLLLPPCWSTSWRAFERWRRDRVAIAALQALDERMLKDIGIGRSEIESAVSELGRDRSRVGRT